MEKTVKLLRQAEPVRISGDVLRELLGLVGQGNAHCAILDDAAELL